MFQIFLIRIYTKDSNTLESTLEIYTKDLNIYRDSNMIRIWAFLLHANCFAFSIVRGLLPAQCGHHVLWFFILRKVVVQTWPFVHCHCIGVLTLMYSVEIHSPFLLQTSCFAFLIIRDLLTAQCGYHFLPFFILLRVAVYSWLFAHCHCIRVLALIYSVEIHVPLRSLAIAKALSNVNLFIDSSMKKSNFNYQIMEPKLIISLVITKKKTIAGLWMNLKYYPSI